MNDIIYIVVRTLLCILVLFTTYTIGYRRGVNKTVDMAKQILFKEYEDTNK